MAMTAAPLSRGSGVSSEKKPGFFQRLFGFGAQEPPKKEPPAPRPAKEEPRAPKPAQKEPPKQKQPAKKAQGGEAAKKAVKLKAPPPSGPHVAKDDSRPPDKGPKGPKPGGGKRPRKPKADAPAAAPPPAGPAAREGATPPEEGAPGTREKGTPEEPDLPPPAKEPETPEDGKPSKASAPTDPQRSWFARLGQGLARTSTALSDNLTSVLSRRKLDEETLDDLEDALIKADLGVAMASRIRQALAATRHERGLSAEALRDLLAAEIAKVLAPVAKPFVLDKLAHPHVILLVGVNGTGKTTTAAKLAHQFMRGGASVMLAAVDTFRAAAIDQLKVWGERVGAEVVTRGVGADPAGVAYEALERARAEKRNVLIIDTAGRLQNKADLMAELAKIVRVLKKLDVGAPHSVVLVLDATTGQNALNQVQIFQEIAGVTNLVVTKLDGTARGGIVVAIAERFGLPVSAIGVGEGVDDLQPFDAQDFARAIAGLDTRNAAAA
jgi:fused signal recognition particle receptor